MSKVVRVDDVVRVLNEITGGRVVTGTADLFTGTNRFVVLKTSHIPGKSVVETPGLVYGRPDKEVRKIGVAMTLTESVIELANACGIDVVLTHHPIADASNSGGVPLRSYLDLYDISVMELHEAFHGLHPGLSWLHGHKAFRVEIAYGGIPGNILYVGKALPEVKTIGDMLTRLEDLMCLEVEKQLLEAECELRGDIEIVETCLATRPEILAGVPENPVEMVAHIFPHTGFTAQHLVQVKKEHPEIDTLLATISRVHRDSELLKQAEEMGLNFVVGNCHAVEIFENGLPLARAIQLSLPEVEVLMLRERVTATALADFGNEGIRGYADDIARTFLLPNKEKVK